MLPFFATCPKGLESLLSDELQALGASQVQETVAGVAFLGELDVAYRACLWSRLASRIMLQLADFPMRDDMDLYLGASNIEWETHIEEGQTFAVDFSGSNRAITNTQYGALKIKDAIVDRLSKRRGERPSVDKRFPDIRILAHLKRERVSITLDLSGPALHQRGYRQQAGEAPLKENLAAAILLRSGWDAKSPLVDPMCGSGTLLIEAALMAADQAPGLLRPRFGFMAWSGHDRELWQSLHAEATVRATRGLNKADAVIYGFDQDKRVLGFARDNAEAAGVERLINFAQGSVSVLKNPSEQPGWLISNPPYGERLSEFPSLLGLHQGLGDTLRDQFKGWHVSLISSSPELLSCLRLRPEKTYKLFNGALACELRNYAIAEDARPARPLAEDFANRLAKNIKTLDKWARNEGIECYRLYDADLPEYNAAIDRYQDHLVIQEYAAPKSVPEHKARARFYDLVQATMTVTGVPGNKVVLKVRARQKGSEQYEKLDKREQWMDVQEHNAHLLVNLHDYLDTGLFLDHRPIRKRLGELSKGKDVLNVFAYTGTATVHAALGGARSTTTVDMSRTYLGWAERNMQLNGMNDRRHQYVQADCLSWLANTDGDYDLIFCDPPTFSNSKRMEESFDVQRDHLELLQLLSKHLRKDGLLIFSNNKRNFKMDLDGLAAMGLDAKNITRSTLPKDFARNPHIHNCWEIRWSEQ
ncbi:bifunctional 23S rRNA (guanine(2069)-N(7))-methyltransferase RlmK/23S rRNA (guanine(2445)-N(2))-methyltransferase RlmL [Oceanimonas sp. CHS3-5]|uniref:bifunctional 23S rRNA (guanine(2069)-N(7))-methyltransferase RlmK/23S rRNA (guanine(2445)-N(2))-methyltransferase RlmL n=1 Tax=Oceanimonas sp. CHS3-5 TaxID=3068186 RepID=UPI00273D7272|nr:bifunctional 23S rRNA (guanine(2069)-N(7))-methyltransferase RlmK/23S rRNA (guanine(2445)-N(2))-methyltransferase RlmL [Oceanimonas sp. CHS3-5]MDP5291957.1 bifunctional 23S rRNA (guanine(2069)-N(7))-methyltransferase RlmK/23S rRNA (guanine(2445)-N(2))-methyltransferase RlmL [Oceanimonas sp. CHS3-5]